ncbi:tRNA synthetase class II core domain (G, h, p, S and t) domain-containing protein [Pochonia chlamydosporia 170]|uniref:Seryl-tRNA(Ser) synthetase n=1 Tax=Pochonia chlamydosporia 170 TaxID=1380566 RepID=A0A219AQ46_METCM|nr:tRNA synthetase class II core domain (G, h, p, S and t) domain-containing protein [Pochonia chlamydosporia 170]OWT42749.1 tRNA synthetase class II core domain (G, h, p, S and t) domain-containing protein [Pochonia chlamydosporia 170]
MSKLWMRLLLFGTITAKVPNYSATQVNSKINEVQKQIGAKENADDLLKEKIELEKEKKALVESAAEKDALLRTKIKTVGNYVHDSVPVRQQRGRTHVGTGRCQSREAQCPFSPRSSPQTRRSSVSVDILPCRRRNSCSRITWARPLSLNMLATVHAIDVKRVLMAETPGEFTIEQFLLTDPEKSWDAFHDMIGISEDFYKSLGLPYQIVSIVSGALNNAASKKLDLEAWFPFQGEYKELVSYSAPRCRLTSRRSMCTVSTLRCARPPEQCVGLTVPEPLRKYLPGAPEFIPFAKELPKESTSQKSLPQRPKGGK